MAKCYVSFFVLLFLLLGDVVCRISHIPYNQHTSEYVIPSLNMIFRQPFHEEIDLKRSVPALGSTTERAVNIVKQSTTDTIFTRASNVSKVFNHYGEVMFERQILAQYLDEILQDINFTHLTNNCRVAVERYIDGVYSMEDWAWEIFDSNGKPESGLKEGNVFWEGRFSQCNGASYSNQNGLRIQGKYFRVSVRGEISQSEQFRVRVGTCFPSVCINQDITHLLLDTSGFMSIPRTMLMSGVNLTLDVVGVDTDKKFWQDYVALSAAATLMFTMLLCVVATIVDGSHKSPRSATTEQCRDTNDQQSSQTDTDTHRPLISAPTGHNYNTLPHAP